MNCWKNQRANAAYTWMAHTRVAQMIAVPSESWADNVNIIPRRTGDKFYGLSFELEDTTFEEKNFDHIRDLIEILPRLGSQEWFQNIIFKFLEEISLPEIEILWPNEKYREAKLHWDIKEKGYVAEKIGEGRYIITPKHFLFQFGLPMCATQYGDYRIYLIPKENTRISNYTFYYSYEPPSSREEIVLSDYIFNIGENRRLFIICGQPVLSPSCAYSNMLRMITEYSEDGVVRYPSEPLKQRIMLNLNVN